MLCITCPLWGELPITDEFLQSVIHEKKHVCTPWRKAIDIAMYETLSPRLQQKAVSETVVYNFGCSGCTRSFYHGNTLWSPVTNLCMWKGIAQGMVYRPFIAKPLTWTRTNCPQKGTREQSSVFVSKSRKFMNNAWTSGLGNNRDTGDSRSYCARYNVTVVGQMGETNFDILYEIPFQRCHMSVMVSPITGHLSVC